MSSWVLTHLRFSGRSHIEVVVFIGRAHGGPVFAIEELLGLGCKAEVDDVDKKHDELLIVRSLFVHIGGST